MQVLPRIVSLVPQSGVQFIDIRFTLEKLPRILRSFWERPMPAGTEAEAPNLVNLRVLTEANDALIDAESGVTPPEEETYNIGRNQALEPYLDRWVPLPVLRIATVMAGGQEVYDKGPTNWARIRIVPLPAPDHDGHTHHAVVAFDTALRAREEARPYTAISPDDSRGAGEFVLVAKRDANAWFMNEAWMAQWLEEMQREMRVARSGPRGAAVPEGRACEHWARYITFLEILSEANLLPRIKLVDVVSEVKPYEPINVDLVLDIGNSRTCGILIEDRRETQINLNNSYPLKLRDLGQPHLSYAQAFESRVEFSRATFGKDTLSRRSGRGNAFQWLAPVRVGTEAMRLAALSRGNEGATGLSSPKRYLWDERPTSQVWRWNGMGSDGTTSEPPVSGSLMTLVSEEGEVLRGTRRRRGGVLSPAMRALFSRSSMMTFLLAELLMQAQSQINAVDTRYATKFADVPRRLRRILLTMPPAMPLVEQGIFRDRVEAAVRLAWDMLGWSQAGIAAPIEPRVIANLDEATATQLVFLYTESTERLRASPGTFFTLTGRLREKYGREPSLRVASIDIGGGTTDLMICTYTTREGQEVEPHQNFREGFRIAGDEVLQEVIQSIVLPQIEQALRTAGLPNAKALLQEVFGGDKGAQSEAERHLRRQLVSQVLERLGLAVLHAYERSEGRANHEVMRRSVGEILAGHEVKAPVHYLEQRIARLGLADFSLAGVEITAFSGKVDAVVQSAVGQVLADLCEAVHAFDCDWLLLSGRPSRLRAVEDIVRAKMPVPPHRIVAMNGYQAGGWYPFRDPAGRVEDPKTTAAVGAMLCALAEGRLEGFLLRSSKLAMKSTARYFGRLELSGQMLRQNVLLEDPDRLPGKGSDGQEISFTMEFRAPTFLGFRQLDLERWNASRLYILEYANPDDVPRLSLPLTLKIRRADISEDAGAKAEALREDFQIEEILDAGGAPQRTSTVRLRLQTEKQEAGYWRDTGALSLQ
ncbi:virulence factor SrfB [Sediminicoccus sp. KRV36]|uniref:virulence factor SrfB n=1 Tax=Sediminicoccus sp. KRV36 TaxID=3133721 RepID=UPI00200C7F58|nr:virulence factor SrfB [Sediminicoccus rosea]UPY38941.1 virulence factor SrfB [Sediminicoccus rosea]